MITQASLIAIDSFVRECQTAGIWEKFIEVGPFAGLNLNAAMVKLVYQPAAGSVLTNSSFIASDYAETGANAGLNGDGTKFLNTNVLSSSLPDNGHLSFYLRDDISSGGNKALIGALTGTDHCWMGALNPAAAVDLRYGALVIASNAGTLSRGFYTGVRESSTSLSLYRDGVLLTNTSLAAGTNKPAFAMYLWAFNSSGSSSARITGHGSFYSMGHSLNATEAAALRAAVQNLQSAFNRAI